MAEALAQEAQPDCPLAATAEERVHCLLVDRRSNLPPSATAKAFEIIVPELPSPVAFSTAGAPLARPSALDVTTRPLPLRRSVLPSPESLLLHPIGDSRGEGGVRLEEVKAGRVGSSREVRPPVRSRALPLCGGRRASSSRDGGRKASGFVVEV